jgi:hypothetical protein
VDVLVGCMSLLGGSLGRRSLARYGSTETKQAYSHHLYPNKQQQEPEPLP